VVPVAALIVGFAVRTAWAVVRKGAFPSLDDGVRRREILI
jgi:hypothetical protein